MNNLEPKVQAPHQHNASSQVSGSSSLLAVVRDMVGRALFWVVRPLATVTQGVGP